MGFIGKLAKMAAGVKQTHVKGSKVDMKLLAEIAQKSFKRILGANTARHVLEMKIKSLVFLILSYGAGSYDGTF